MSSATHRATARLYAAWIGLAAAGCTETAERPADACPPAGDVADPGVWDGFGGDLAHVPKGSFVPIDPTAAGPPLDVPLPGEPPGEPGGRVIARIVHPLTGVPPYRVASIDAALYAGEGGDLPFVEEEPLTGPDDCGIYRRDGDEPAEADARVFQDGGTLCLTGDGREIDLAAEITSSGRRVYQEPALMAGEDLSPATSWAVALGGGEDVGPLVLDAPLEMPPDLEVGHPDGAEIDLDGALFLWWSPPPAGSAADPEVVAAADPTAPDAPPEGAGLLFVTLTATEGRTVREVRCAAVDDGWFTVPEEAVASLEGARVRIELRRTFVRWADLGGGRVMALEGSVIAVAGGSR